MSASTEPMSGLGAPERTATPTPDFARSTRLPGTILPSCVSSSMSAAEAMSASAGSPACTRFRMSTIPAHSVATWQPLDFSNCGTSSR